MWWEREVVCGRREASCTCMYLLRMNEICVAHRLRRAQYSASTEGALAIGASNVSTAPWTQT